MMAAVPSEANLDIQASSPAENTLLKDGDVVSPSCTIFQESQKPADSKKESQKPDKKQTRQWAAWTRQEEENFFNALRQVGKDFEKITYRVQSKNKDQVRHYYYRLVRRMNKLLGPGLCLDAKNSKDTVAAMLRWWSLLEKFSCTASKLHLRPRRFKIFVETLENQLLKDRNKTRRKRPSQGDNSLATSSTTSLISKAATNDSRPAKVFVVDSQNSHKVGANKGASLRRNVTPSVTFNKEDLSATKTVKQKRRGVTSASYRRWEKAAMAGVSLVADAAEQLEQAANNDRNCSIDHGNFSATPPEKYTTDGMCPQIREATPQPSMKLKLQLFPMDEGTRKALEKDAHNPHLELTLSARKRISSVLEHLNRKWGNSAKGMGEVMLFPYSAQQEDIGSHRRWTIRDTDATAADVYATVGSPSIFRLRYGWFCSPEVGSGIINVICSKNIEEVHAEDVPDTETVAANIMEHVITTNHFSDPVKFSKHQSTVGVAHVRSVSGTAEPMCGGGSGESEPMCGGSSAESEPMCGGGSSGSNYRPPNTSGETTFSWHGNSMAQLQDMVNLGTSNAILTPGEWADSLTTISVGDLLSEASKAADPSFLNSSAGGQLEQIPFSCDSFDAAIAAHVSGHQLTNLSTVSHASIWNAEETCDEFSFHNIAAFKGNNLKPLDVSRGPCTQVTHPNSSEQYGYHNELPEFKPSEDPSYHNQKTELVSAKQLSYDNKYDPAGDTFLTDIYWPDSLGPFELDMPSSRYQTQDMILGESISVGGLSRLIASSVDAFQNCSFFGVDKKDISAGEARGGPIPLDNKIGSDD